jgi:hypothetical protein
MTVCTLATRRTVLGSCAAINNLCSAALQEGQVRLQRQGLGAHQQRVSGPLLVIPARNIYTGGLGALFMHWQRLYWCGVPSAAR